MAGKGIVEHSGIVDHIEGRNIFVKILAQSACISCKLNGVCGTDTQEKIIEISNVNTNVEPGEKVSVVMTEKLGMKALFYGYLLPFLVVLTVLIIVLGVTNREGLSGLIAVLSLAPYYAILSLFKVRLKQSFQFNLHKSMQ
ncbi:MAG: SoxR reducing system RseC family protein [Bacteroidales bacterium]|jgi:positive regulator of sigma E activity|nr:SoxR reducing system RseC family protein [Bacteroidales bacterium]